MEPTEIPTPPSDPLFYKWLAGIAVAALSAIFLYLVHGVLGEMKKSNQRLDEIEKAQIRQEARNEIVENTLERVEGRLKPLEAKVFQVNYPAPGYRKEDWK